MSVEITRTNPAWTEKLLQRVMKSEDREIAVGFPKGISKAYPDGTSVIEVAAKNCFGIGVPQRDFMSYGSILIERDQIIKDALKIAASETGAKEIDSMQQSVGNQAVMQIQRAIDEGDWKPNSPITIALKGSSKPLIDTTHMKNAVTFVVRKKSA